MGLGIGNGNANLFSAVVGAPSPAPVCPTGYSLEFDGITEFAKGSTPPDLGGGTGDFTISFWMKTPDSTGGGINQRILDVELGGVYQWTLYVNGPAGYVQFTANPLAGGWSDGFNPYIIPNDTWVFIAYSVDRSGLAKWSANGGSINTKNVSSFPINLSGGDLMYLGRNDTGQYFEGNLCHLAIWNTTLNLTELGELYNNTTGLCYASDFSFSTNLKNYWPCFNPDGIFTNPLIDTVGTSTIPLINMDATNVSTDHPL